MDSYKQNNDNIQSQENFGWSQEKEREQTTSDIFIAE
jgi:hypothetical protein